MQLVQDSVLDTPVVWDLLGGFIPSFGKRTPTDYSSSVAGLNHPTPGQGQLLFVEASRSKGCGKLTVTGQLGEVMLESVKTAM